MNVRRRHGAKTQIWVVGRCGRVGQEHHAIITEHRIARCGVAAVFGGGPGNDDGIDAPLPQDDIEVGSEKAAVAMFLDYTPAISTMARLASTTKRLRVSSASFARCE